VISFISLNASFDSLDDCKDKDDDRDPKRPPLHRPTVVPPRLKQAARFMVIVDLLDDYQTVSPVVEPAHIAPLDFQILVRSR
jgi:hypothetical protein